MSANESRLLAVLVLAAALGATAIHAVLKLETPEVAAPAPLATPPPHDESVVLALASQARSEPANPAGSWHFVWEGTRTALLALEAEAEKAPGGYFVTSLVLREANPGRWVLDLVLSPWQEGLASPPQGWPTLSALQLAEALHWSIPAVRKVPAPTLPQAASATAAAAPAVPTIVGDLTMLGSYGDGTGRHWWIKENGTDRVFQVPGAEDWSLVQADGAAIVLQRDGVLHRVEIIP